MSNSILIMGDSGSGKTTSMRNLNPEETFYIDADKKGLSWKGWKKQYNHENKNYYKNSSPDKIIEVMLRISKEMPHIKVIVVDTLNWIMIDDEFNRMKEKGYDKWQDMAYSIMQIVGLGNQLREDLTVIFTAHTQTERDDSGYMYTKMKTSGKKLDKISVESMFNTVLLARCKDAANQEYVFETQANSSTAKTPLGAFETMEIPNDVVEVLKVLEEF
jgi:GTPase SAR1 family protein